MSTYLGTLYTLEFNTIHATTSQWGSETKKVKVAPNNLSDRDLK